MKKKRGVSQDMMEMSDAILDGVEEMIKQSEKRLTTRIAESAIGTEKRLMREIRGIKKDMVYREEFEDLKKKVNRHHPTS